MDVLALLQAKGIEVTPKGNGEYSIICPNAGQHQDGSDSIPSFNINIDKLKAGCFACGYRMNEVGLTKWLMGEDLDEAQLRSLKLKSAMKRVRGDVQLMLVESSTGDVMFPFGDAWNEDYRNIKADTYKKLGAVKVSRGRYADRICFPIIVDGNLIGVDARTLLPDVQPKYLRNFGSSCKDQWLYPFDEAKKFHSNYIILGEGIFHGINCLDKGFPGLAFFGSNNWSQAKVMKLLDLNVSEVIYFRDEDKAGRVAEQSICASLAQWFTVTVIGEDGIPEGKDLGDLTKDEIDAALATRHRPLLPKCLIDHPFGGIKIITGATCYDRRCYFCEKGVCTNEVG